VVPEEEDAAGAPNDDGPSGARRAEGEEAGEDRAEEGRIAVNADAGLTAATTTTRRGMVAINLFMMESG